MNNNLASIKANIYDKIGFQLSNFKLEQESKEYDACQFELNGLSIISRSAKITPKKVGQFVTFWKRKENGPIEPFHATDHLDFYVVNIRSEHQFGQFVFPKSVLIAKGIISTSHKEGKRAFRVYPPWDVANNKQAERSQKWQLEYFYGVNKEIDWERVKSLFV